MNPISLAVRFLLRLHLLIHLAKGVLNLKKFLVDLAESPFEASHTLRYENQRSSFGLIYAATGLSELARA
jgi:hypothetical protein